MGHSLVLVKRRAAAAVPDKADKRWNALLKGPARATCLNQSGRPQINLA
jgi:hypothetical protein